MNRKKRKELKKEGSYLLGVFAATLLGMLPLIFVMELYKNPFITNILFAGFFMGIITRILTEMVGVSNE